MTTGAQDSQPTGDSAPADGSDRAVGATDPNATVVLPAVSGRVPRRDSVIPRTSGPITLPSGRVSRPVADYLEADPDAIAADRPFDRPSADLEVDARQEAWASGPQVITGSGRSGGDGPRIPRWALFGGIGAACVALIVVVVLASGGHSTPAVTVSLTASPSAPAVVGFFDDGIAADEYPPLAASRGTEYPAAFTMEDWVWDRIGTNWAVVIYSGWSYESSADDAPDAVAYLASPEGALFELAVLPDRVANGATIVSWHEDTRTARITWDGGVAGGMLDLTTGEVDDTSFQMSTGRTKGVRTLAVNAEGDELWAAFSDDFIETRYFAWSAAGGWNQILSGQDDLYLEFPNRTTDSDRVAFAIHPVTDSAMDGTRSLPLGVVNFVVYTLSSGSATRVTPGLGSEEAPCWFGGMIDVSGAYVGCWNDAEGTSEDWRVSVDGSGAIAPYEYSSEWFQNLSGETSLSSPDVPLELIIDPDTSGTVAINRRTDEGMVPFIDVPSDFGEVGIYISAIDEVAAGAYRLTTSNRSVWGIDTNTATFAPLVWRAPGDTGIWPTYVYYGESTPVIQLWSAEGGD